MYNEKATTTKEQYPAHPVSDYYPDFFFYFYVFINSDTIECYRINTNLKACTHSTYLLSTNKAGSYKRLFCLNDCMLILAQ